MNNKEIKWGNVELPGLTDEQLYGKRWLDRSEEHNKKIGKAHKGKKRDDNFKQSVSDGVNKWLKTLTDEERKEMFTNKSMLNKKHKAETIRKMKKKAKNRVISEQQKKKISETLGIPIIATNLKTGKQRVFKSTKEANIKLGLTGVLHVLKGRAKQCGGWFFEYKN